MIPIGHQLLLTINVIHESSTILHQPLILTHLIHSILPTNDLDNLFFSKNFLPCINHPTKIYGQSLTIIDSIFINMIDSKIIRGNILTHIPEHFPQFLILRNANICYNYRGSFKYDYSIFDETNFINDFNKIDFSFLNSGYDIDSIYNKFLDHVKFLVNEHILSGPNKRPPLINFDFFSNPPGPY